MDLLAHQTFDWAVLTVPGRGGGQGRAITVLSALVRSEMVAPSAAADSTAARPQLVVAKLAST